MIELQSLVAEAIVLGGGDLCAADHAWQSEGGRGCPNLDFDIGCGQAVYRCARCGVHDYGEPGGPGAADCHGCQRWQADAEEAAQS
jgi:hypothetical protein